MLLPFPELVERLDLVYRKLGMSNDRAHSAALLTAGTDRDGVKTHGIARLPRFAEMVHAGRIRVEAEPEREQGLAALEQWTGNLGPGQLAAEAMTARAMELAAHYGIGGVALRDTTHWMRGGSYGWQAAEQGYALLAWTNTLPNLPPWGGKSPALGNNPLVMAVPHPHHPVVLDMAMSQFSYGALTSYREREEELPVPGGFDRQGELSRVPAEIEQTQRALPIGFWKGSGLAFVLDVLAAMLAGGKATHQIAPDPLAEVGLSQVFLAVRPDAVTSLELMRATVDGCIDALHAATAVNPGVVPRYPGESTLRVRERSLHEGVRIEDSTWDAFRALEQKL